MELNKRAAAEARKRGFRVFTDYLEEFQSEHPIEVVVLSHVLEHSLKPEEMLAMLGASSNQVVKHGSVYF